MENYLSGLVEGPDAGSLMIILKSSDELRAMGAGRVVAGARARAGVGSTRITTWELDKK